LRAAWALTAPRCDVRQASASCWYHAPFGAAEVPFVPAARREAMVHELRHLSETYQS